MNLKLLKKLSLATTAMLAFATASLYGSCCNPCREDVQTKCDKTYEQGHIMCESKMMGAYNAPARIEVAGCWDMYVDASFIYWQAKQKCIDYATLGPADITAENPATAKILKNDFEWKPGFQVGLGMNFDHDSWFGDIHYTRLHATDRNSHVAGEGEIIDPTFGLMAGSIAEGFITENDAFKKGNTKWKLHYDIIYARLGRPYYLGTKLTFNPHFGLEGGWIRQKNTNTFSRDDNEEIILETTARNRTWLVGPKMGVETNWLIGCGFRMFGNGATGLFYQRSSDSFNYFGNIPGITIAGETLEGFSFSAPLKNTDSTITPKLELGLGFGWGTYFGCGCDKGWHFDASLGYDFLTYWDQNPTNPKCKGGNLFLHGLTVKLRLDF